MIWKADAPSNIALIKYMGKTDLSQNIPANSSLSYTLEKLRTFVEIRTLEGEEDRWVSLEGPHLDPEFCLSERGELKVLSHLKKIKERFGYHGALEVRSNNTFPSDCGLASSASSFAALTICASEALRDLTRKTLEPNEIIDLSRSGSGSSCRSFFGPWALWDRSGVRAIELKYVELNHVAVVVDDGVKEVSSSDAHRRVTSSLLFQGRAERAELRLNALLQALTEAKWNVASEVVWSEFWDMHALFETSEKAFGYLKPGTLEVLSLLREQWKTENDGPLITMDAGPNIHLLYRLDQQRLQREMTTQLNGRYQLWESDCGYV